MGLTLGMFFPSGIEILNSSAPRFVPWAWGVNGCASVVGTVLAVMLAMTSGFQIVSVVALVLYAVGVLAIRSVDVDGA